MSASGGSTHAPNRCLYVALDVPRDASPTDIKKAYRKQALVWHPDKNVGNEAEARVRFQELQHAYAVLSDPNERRWYDDHRDEILNPHRYAECGDSDDESGRGRTVNLTKYFSAAAFTGFGDDDAGFYQTYNRAFHEVWECERDWGEAAAAPGEESWGNRDPPEIGRSSDGYETAEAFYNRWGCFVSGLSFGWVDEYNVNEADSRRMRRLMEKENAKKRASAKKKYQDDVRALVEFCRRRDRRVIKHKVALAKEKEARERKKEEEVRLKREDMKRRKAEWARVRQEEQAAEEAARKLEGADKAFRVGETDSEEEQKGGATAKKGRGKRRQKKMSEDLQQVTVFRCAVCKKDFKSKGQMANHETSKAHKKKMEQLDAEMLREAAKVDEIDSVAEEDSDAIENIQRQDEEDETDNDFFMDSAMQELRESERDGQSVGPSEKDAVVTERNVCGAWEEPASRTNEGRGRFGGKSDSTSSSTSSDGESSEDRDDHDLMTAFAKVTVEEGGDTSESSSTSKTKGRNNVEDSTVRPLTAVESSTGLSENDQDDDIGSAIDDGDVRGESLEPAGRRERRKAVGVSKQGDVGPGTAVGGGKSCPAVKGARRRRRQAVKAAKDGRAKGDADDGLGCRICGRRFPSRSKLFAHVKAEGHAVLA